MLYFVIKALVWGSLKEISGLLSGRRVDLKGLVAAQLAHFAKQSAAFSHETLTIAFGDALVDFAFQALSPERSEKR